MDKRKKALDLLGAALISLALGFALTMTLCHAFTLTPAPGFVLLACAAVSLLCTLAASGRVGAIGSIALAGGIALLLCLSPVRALDQIRAFFQYVADMAASGEFAPSDYSALLGACIGVLLTVLTYWMARMTGGVYPAITLAIAVMLGGWLVERRIDPLYAVIAVAALIALFSHAVDEKMNYLRAVPLALAAALIALLLTPAGNVAWPPLRDAADRARALFDDYFLFNEPRTTYSISADGFQPMGELLGGPAEPSTTDIMVVETDAPVYLRGSIKRSYTTYSWTENAVNSRYLLIDPLRKGVRDAIFDADLPRRIGTEPALTEKTIGVSFLSEGYSTLFVPHRLIDLSASLDMPTYFSSSGEVFITRNVTPADAYTVRARIQTGSQANLRDLALAAAQGGDDRFAAIKNEYTALPRGIEQGVYALAARIIEGASTPYERAAAILRHLQSNYEYSLNPPYPTLGRDFVSEFLLETKQGYCSYFASAMAVLGRIAGLPTRYVEGYLVPARENAVTVVSGKNAHAWVEVYFEGLGWISFDPTPGNGDSYQPPQGDGASDNAAQDDQTPPQSDPDAQGDETPPDPDESAGEPTPPPESPTPSPDAGDEGSDEGDGSDDSESDPPPDDTEPPDSPESDDTSDEPDPPKNLVWLWLLLILLALIGACVLFVVRRLRATDPRNLAANRRGAQREERLMVWYRALLLVLEEQGQTPAAGESPTQFAERLRAGKIVGDAFAEVAAQVALCRYAGRAPDTGAYRKAATAYDQCVKQLKKLEKLRWLARRIVKGLGDTRAIP